MLCEWAREGMGVTHNCSSSSSYSETCSQASPTSSFWSLYIVLCTNKVTGGGEGLRTRPAGSPYLSMGGLMYSHMPSDLTSSSCRMHETKASRDWISVSEGTWWERDTLHVNIIVYTVCTQHGERCYSVSPQLLSHNAPYFCTLCGKSITSTWYHMTTTLCITWHHMTSHELHTWHHMTSHELHTWHPWHHTSCTHHMTSHKLHTSHDITWAAHMTSHDITRAAHMTSSASLFSVRTLIFLAKGLILFHRRYHPEMWSP